MVGLRDLEPRNTDTGFRGSMSPLKMSDFILKGIILSAQLASDS